MANSNHSGIFYMKQDGKRIPAFPKEFRRGPFSRLERKFLIIFGGLVFLFYTTVGLLSTFVKVDTSQDEKQILKIQERYAELVMNQPKPKEEVKKEEKSTTGPAIETKEEVKEEDTKEEVKVDRAKESFAEKEQRKEASSETRRQVREQVSKQIQSSGIFAAITATGGSGSGGGGSAVASAADLLGTATDDGLGDLSNLNVTKGSFATRKADAAGTAGVTERKGTRTTDVGIEKQSVGKAEVTQVASAANVNITSAPPEISGESSTHADRSQAAIQRVVQRETQRLKRVYEDWLKRDPALSGRLTVKFTILPSGAVSNVSVVKTTMNNPEFDETILRYIKRWQFPEVSGGTPVEVVYPFVFEGQS
jgi:TonB family protein